MYYKHNTSTNIQNQVFKSIIETPKEYELNIIPEYRAYNRHEVKEWKKNKNMN